ncbi:MAG: geranylgeranylglyceryl/heptaprenylglyceryl phosphate synthase [Candidatus Diapherotrites archaeon]|nr:geranylgeranylglyceryl/heptaprenylglyceryl phosphate synthase [Candidatus Diapherotrites archaeon]
MKQKVYQKILEEISAFGGLVFLVIDPPNQEPKTAGEIAKIAQKVGVSAICVGGSVGAQGAILDQAISEIKANCSIPVILFPGNIASLSKHADALYFMSMLNSTDPYYITGAQIASAATVKHLGIEVIPTSYIVIEPGRAVGWVGRAQLIPRNLPYLAAITALAGQFLGSKMVILESGGGAESPVPPELVAATKKMVDVPLVVAGGVRDEKFAYETIRAGADIVHVGTAAEETNSDPSLVEKTLSRIVDSVKKAGKEKLQSQK